MSIPSSPIYYNQTASFNIISPAQSSSSASTSSFSSPLSTSPIKRSPSFGSVIPPLPPSSSAKFPLELTSKNQTCIVRLDLDKTYFSNGSNITGKVIVNLTERQCLKRIKIQISGYEKIFQERENNTYQTLKFYTDDLNISPLNFIKDVNNPTITQHPNYKEQQFQQQQQKQQERDHPMSLSFNSLGFVHEFEAGTYEYRFCVKLPSYLQPSLNYIGFLSIFYMAHCKVEYSKGKDWKENKILKSTEFLISGIDLRYQDHLMAMKKSRTAQQLSSFKVSEFLWKDKSKPFEMALCLADKNLYIGDNALIYIKIKNPLETKFNSIKVDLFQQITFKKQQYPLLKLNRQHMAFFKHGNQFHPVASNSNLININDYTGNGNHNGEKSGNNPHKHKVSVTQILSLNFDSSHLCQQKIIDNSNNININNNNTNDEILSTQIKVTIPKSFEDDQVYPSTRGHLSTIKHYFIISIPSINNLKIKIPFTLWEKERYSPLTNGNSNNNIISPLSTSPKNDYLINNNLNIHNHLVINQEYKPPPENWKIFWLPTWKDETNESKCNLCDSSFSIIKRIHHCRNCGGVFCESCSSQKYSLFSYGIHKKVRICLMCVENIKEKQLHYFQLSQTKQERTDPPILFSKKKQLKYPFLIDIIDK
ncbi:hypothetical protein CYY_004755 [Polysphondylium violaceum]|uniref:FYVE-type domain-containing protein n=1 Tax=Polysphondylium violaceum TaxID=133409 RepID=A0A8J4Q4S2_9MYCE|nr:hypothetical protein CYY_004755 [Polysphondylium violaceum]